MSMDYWQYLALPVAGAYIFLPNTTNENLSKTLIGTCGIEIGKTTKEFKHMTPFLEGNVMVLIYTIVS